VARSQSPIGTEGIWILTLSQDTIDPSSEQDFSITSTPRESSDHEVEPEGGGERLVSEVVDRSWRRLPDLGRGMGREPQIPDYLFFIFSPRLLLLSPAQGKDPRGGGRHKVIYSLGRAPETRQAGGGERESC
jgi:hypothetical protein